MRLQGSFSLEKNWRRSRYWRDLVFSPSCESKGATYSTNYVIIMISIILKKTWVGFACTKVLRWLSPGRNRKSDCLEKQHHKSPQQSELFDITAFNSYPCIWAIIIEFFLSKQLNSLLICELLFFSWHIRYNREFHEECCSLLLLIWM